MLDQILDRQKLSAEQEAAMSKTFLSSVFSYMFGALVISGVFAYLFSHNANLLQMIINVNEFGIPTGYSTFGYVAMFSPLIFILVMNFGINKLSSISLLILFIAFSAMMGMSLSTIFLAYSTKSIMLTFGITGGTFGIMAVLGYTTQTDLTKMGSLLMMALFGLILAMVVNWFMQSSSLDYLITIGGVIIFTGLIAFETQQLKRIGAGIQYGTEQSSKLAIMGAMSLYLSFINLFLFLLRLFGSRD